MSSHTPSQARLIDRFTAPLVHFMERYYPELFLFIIIITLITFAGAYWFADFGPRAMLSAWGNSLGDILAFSMQMALMVMISHALAHTDAMQRLLHRLGSVPRSPVQAYGFVTAATGLICFISWPLGIIGGGILARNVGESTRERGLRVHYPLLVAAAFCGNVIWHMGYSASAPLFVATEDHSMLALTGGVIPMTETVFTTWNLSLAAVVLLGTALLAAYLRPNEDDIIEFKPVAEPAADTVAATQDEQNRPVAKLETSRGFTLVIGTCLTMALAFWFIDNGFQLNLDVVNWTFLALTLLLCRSARHFMQLISNSAPAAAPLIIAYPFYAGIIGVMTESGIVSMMSAWFASIASTESLPIWAFLSAMLVNLFIPSGGAQWVVQGPIFLESARQMAVDPSLIVMAIAYGDQLTNLLQPLPAIPLLALAGLRLKHIMGYAFIFFLAGFVMLLTGLTLISYF